MKAELAFPLPLLPVGQVTCQFAALPDASGEKGRGGGGSRRQESVLPAWHLEDGTCLNRVWVFLWGSVESSRVLLGTSTHTFCEGLCSVCSVTAQPVFEGLHHPGLLCETHYPSCQLPLGRIQRSSQPDTPYLWSTVAVRWGLQQYKPTPWGSQLSPPLLWGELARGHFHLILRSDSDMGLDSQLEGTRELLTQAHWHLLSRREKWANT